MNLFTIINTSTAVSKTLKKYTTIKIIGLLLASLYLTACGGGNDQQPPPTSAARFSHIKMHYNLLHDQNMIWGEFGSKVLHDESLTLHLPILRASAKGTTFLHVSNTSELLPKQLITYRGNDGIYYTGQVRTIINNEDISLYRPLKATVNAGNNAWDFYGNGSHANTFGFRSIADFAVKSLNFGSQTTGTHLLLGDSWFDEGSLYNRLVQKLPNATVINKGIGGNTTRDLLSRFNRDVTPNNPDYVWIMSGTNDYWQGIPTAEFKANLNTLINKSKAIGAKVIVIDSSVGEGTNQDTHIPNKQQSDAYANAVQDLY